MTPEQSQRVSELLHAARELPATERLAYLDWACAGDSVVRAEVDSLLAVDGLPTVSLLGIGAAGMGGPQAGGELDPMVGHTIGGFRIKAVIAEGGMGTVYEAEQVQPHRRVALKVIREGFSSPSLLRRFEAEAEILGRLQHPGIAQIYEAGTFDSGRGKQPFFAMELIKGRPLTRFAQEQRLSVRQRLDLLTRICQAVQHAHGRGIIHRDLKPANILVDESGQPKILDFGVARATDSDIKTTTLQTDIGQLIGTLSYMSPEQAGGNPDDLDTRSDVYALGVIAYEMLSDRMPYDLNKKMIHEAVRIIREDQPSKLSTINRTLRGDLEVIVGKAMEKEKIRRYQTAAALQADIERYLKDEPIAARPPGTWYQLSKFSRRNKALVGGVAALFVSLAAGLGATLWQKAKAEARADELKQVSDFQAQMLSEVDPTMAGARLSEDVRVKFDAALTKAGEPETDRAAHVEEFMSQWRRVNATDAARDLIDRTILKPAIAAIDKQFKGQPVVDAQLRQVLADRYRDWGLYDAAMPLQQEALATRQRELGKEHPSTLISIGSMGMLLMAQTKLGEAEPYVREAMERSRRVLGEEHPDTLYAIGNMGTLLRAQHKLGKAELCYREALEKRRRILGEEHADTLTSIEHLGGLLQDQGQLSEAESYFRETQEKRQRVLGDEHPSTIYAMGKVGVLLTDQNKLTEAEPYARGAMEKSRRVLGEEHPDTLISIENMASLLRAQGNLAGAEACLREVLEKRRLVLGEEHLSTLTSISNLGVLLQTQGKLSDAEPYRREAMEGFRRMLGDEHPSTLISINNMGALLEAQGKHAEAAQLLGPAEPATRKTFTGGDARPLAVFLMRLGKARTGLGELAAAAANLVEAHSIFVTTRGEAHKETRDCTQALVDLYTAWHAAEPGKGYDARAAEWKAKLEAVQSATQEAPQKVGG